MSGFGKEKRSVLMDSLKLFYHKRQTTRWVKESNKNIGKYPVTGPDNINNRRLSSMRSRPVAELECLDGPGGK